MTPEEEKGYQGWTNYETWCVKLWIDNEESSYNYWQERAEELLEDAVTPTVDLADELEEAFVEGDPLEEAGVYTDLLYSALGKVNWYEIAKSILEEVKE
jgi:hypothetical protein